AHAAHGVVERVTDVRGNHDLVSRPDVQRAKGQLERGAARAHRGGVRGPRPRSQLALEGGDLGALRDPAVGDHRGDALRVGLVERRTGVGNQRFSNSRTDWKASAYFTRAWMPRKLAQDLASSRIVRSSMFVLATCERWASRQASFLSSTFSTS